MELLHVLIAKEKGREHKEKVKNSIAHFLKRSVLFCSLSNIFFLSFFSLNLNFKIYWLRDFSCCVRL